MDPKLLKILIVDDEETNIILLKGILQRAGYSQLAALQDPRQVAKRFEAYQPDLLLLDLHMPYLDGFGVLAELQPLIPEGIYFPILMLTADVRHEAKQRALASGAKDFLTKPFDPTEVKLRMHNLLEARVFNLQLQENAQRLEERVQERTQQLEETQVEMLVRLARAAEYRDDESGEHVWRVAFTAALLAEELGLARPHIELLVRAARLHDVGKIAIPDGILLKPSSLTAAEFEVVKTHTTVGAHLLSGGRSALMRTAELIALTHHERWDGSGYPKGLRGEAIPLESRILAVADTFDALTHDRSHRRAVGAAVAAAEIEAQRGKQFDPQVVEAFGALYQSGKLSTPPEQR